MKPEAMIRWLLTGAACAVLLVLVLEGLSGSLPLRQAQAERPPHREQSQGDAGVDHRPEIPGPALDQLFKETRGTLSNYRDRDRKAAQETLQEIDKIFADYRAHVPAFVGEVYSLNGKWKTVKGFLHDRYSAWFKGDRTDRVEKYVRSVWTDHFGAANELQSELVQALRSLAAKLEAHRNTMLVKIDGHLDDLDRFGEFELELDRATFEQVLMQQTMEAAERSAKVGMTAEMVSLAGGELSAYTLLRLLRVSVRGSIAALSSTTAGSVAASSSATGSGLLMSGWTTLGIGLVVGILVDYGVTHHAKTRMESRLEQALLRMEMRIMHGGGESPGLSKRIRQAFDRYENRKDRAVRASLRETLGVEGIDLSATDSKGGYAEAKAGS